MLNTLVTSKTRVRLLVKFFINAANNGHLRGLADEFNESTNSIRKELNNLSEAGYLNRVTVQNKINYEANTKHPLFGTLQNLVFHYLGLPTIIEMILERMGIVEQIYIVGDYARGIDSGTIEVVIVGQQLNKEYLDQLEGKIEKVIERKVQFYFKQKDEDLSGLIIYENS
ncbi:ArsR family transcriptional regulator [Flavobacterium sp. AS60]|uniref:ArsR family transcriptional regulator n=1 Tax=Flavobacterium anseongense TaxID=2910677 RepID=UPI001F25F825|nr:ArsR family transcriptional regulator [Flavobacterium sp. AS60]MCF6129880.1 ArsR family transcriptional regulator [Flavobacterium sp. AS60]